MRAQNPRTTVWECFPSRFVHHIITLPNVVARGHRSQVFYNTPPLRRTVLLLLIQLRVKRYRPICALLTTLYSGVKRVATTTVIIVIVHVTLRTRMCIKLIHYQYSFCTRCASCTVFATVLRTKDVWRGHFSSENVQVYCTVGFLLSGSFRKRAHLDVNRFSARSIS